MGFLLDPETPARPLLLPAQGSHTVEKEGDALGESQGCHEPVDLEDVVPGRGVRDRKGWGASVRGRDGRAVMRGAVGPPRARALRVLAEDGHPEDASGQEAGRHDHVQLEKGDFRRRQEALGVLLPDHDLGRGQWWVVGISCQLWMCRAVRVSLALPLSSSRSPCLSLPTSQMGISASIPQRGHRQDVM